MDTKEMVKRGCCGRWVKRGAKCCPQNGQHPDIQERAREIAAGLSKTSASALLSCDGFKTLRTAHDARSIGALERRGLVKWKTFGRGSWQQDAPVITDLGRAVAAVLAEAK